MEPITILGKIVVPDELIRYNKDLLPVEATNFRMPNMQYDLDCCGAEVWHQDGDRHTYGLMVWSNIYPTEVLLPSGDVVTGESYDVVLINNQVCKHRIPPALLREVKKVRFAQDLPQRYFTRAHINRVVTDLDIERWRNSVAHRAKHLRTGY